MSQSAAQQRTEAQSETESDETAESEPTRHPEYTETTKSAYGSNGDARKAFGDMEIKPGRIARRSELRRSFDSPAYYHYGSSVHCYQWDNGAGLMERTNRQNRGTSRIRAQDGETVSGPGNDVFLSWIDNHDLSVPEIVTQHSGDDSRNTVVEFEPGHYGVILYDRSAGRQGTRYAGLMLSPDDPRHSHVAQILSRDAYGELSDIVAPPEVLASDLDVVDSTTYRNGGDRYSHGNDGGYGSEEHVGDYIIRQGEHYFIAKPDMFVPTNMVEKPLKGDATSQLGSHVPRDQYVLEEGSDQAQQRLGETPDVEPGIYVRGTVRHSRNEHSMMNLYEVWHKAVENVADMFVFEQETRGRWE